MKPHKPATKPPIAPQGRAVNTAALALVLAGAVFSAIAGWQLAGLWRRLPQNQFEQLERQDFEHATAYADSHKTPQIVHGQSFAAVSNTFAAALHDKVDLVDFRRAASERLRGLTLSQLGRLQQAAIAMLALERAGTPPAQWQPALRPYLDGLGEASFTHYQLAPMELTAQAYEAQGVSRGTARGFGELSMKQPHGPFLQFFVPRMLWYSAALAAGGDAPAALASRQIVYRLLRQWVVEPGTAGLRLLSADMLAEALENEGLYKATSQPTSGPAQGAASAPAVVPTGVEVMIPPTQKARELAAVLRAWANVYRRASHSQPVAALDYLRQPTPCAGEHERLLAGVALTTWTLGAALAAGLIALAGLALWARSGLAALDRTALLAIVAAALLVGCGWWLISHDMAWAQADLFGTYEKQRAMTPAADSVAYRWPRMAIVAGLAALGVVVLGALAPGGTSTRGRVERVARFSAWVWLLLAVSLCGVAAWVEHSRQAYEQAVRAAYDKGEIEAMAGPEADLLLSAIRTWRP